MRTRTYMGQGRKRYAPGRAATVRATPLHTDPHTQRDGGSPTSHNGDGSYPSAGLAWRFQSPRSSGVSLMPTGSLRAGFYTALCPSSVTPKDPTVMARTLLYEAISRPPILPLLQIFEGCKPTACPTAARFPCPHRSLSMLTGRPAQARYADHLDDLICMPRRSWSGPSPKPQYHRRLLRCTTNRSFKPAPQPGAARGQLGVSAFRRLAGSGPGSR